MTNTTPIFPILFCATCGSRVDENHVCPACHARTATGSTAAPVALAATSMPVDRMLLIPGEKILFRPLLTIMTDTNGGKFLWHWCDCDSECGRWLVSRASAEGLNLVDRERPPIQDYRAALVENNTDPFVYFCDRNDEVERWSICPISEIPANYLPGEPQTRQPIWL